MFDLVYPIASFSSQSSLALSHSMNVALGRVYLQPIATDVAQCGARQ
jgi:hypothetical protein